MTLLAARQTAAHALTPRGRVRTARSLTAVWLRSHAAALLIAVITLAGFGLRIEAARGDLWMDELWSLDLVSHITSPDQVFWNISHDNNHFLNSLWMYLVGQQASAMIYRLPSIVFSTAAILVSARIGWRVNAAAGVAGAALAAFSYAFVDYGSEARGYGGLILAILMAIDLWQTLLDRLTGPAVADEPGWRSRRWRLAAVIALGTCAHLTMIVEAAILAFGAAVRLLLAGVGVRKAIDLTLDLFRRSLLLLLPIFAVIAIGMKVQGGFILGGVLPFTPERFLKGYGGLVNVLLGFPNAAPPWTGLLFGGALIAAALATRTLDRRWLGLAVVALVVWPGAVFALRVGNTEFARYFLVAGLLLPVFLAEIAGRLWARNGVARAAGVVLIALVCAGQVPNLRELIVDHRGAPAAAVRLMAGEGPTTFRARNSSRVDPVIDVYATALGVDVKPSKPDDLCRLPAGWAVYDADYGEAVPETLALGPPGCVSTYEKVQAFPAPLWSGRSWTLYRRQP